MATAPVSPNERHRRFKRLQKRTDLGSRKIAEMTGVHQVTVCNWMSGKYAIPLATLLYLENLYPVG